MLFNSYVFLFVFLPVTLVVFAVLQSRRGPMLGWLVAASLFFYGWWDPRFLALLGTSILMNYGLGRALARSGGRGATRALMLLGVVANLGAIGFFKYAMFLLDTFAFATGGEPANLSIVLPLGISFFTFQQIAYLADVREDPARCERSLVRYALFVSFFPQLIAGPIVHHSQMIPQLVERARRWRRPGELPTGLSYFAVGLFKKVIVADGVAAYATPVFAAAEAGTAPDLVAAWCGSLAYTFQIYFDFSGYSDMAIGLGLMFGLRLPFNFDSPYKSLSIIDFWRRWHMTLSAFLRDYVYFPLGGNRHGESRRFLNVFATMFLGGLWHGAGWTFVAWGSLHGVYLAINHLFRDLRGLPRGPVTPRNRLTAALSGGLTFLAVVFGWVLFRAESFEGALLVLEGMVGMHGIVLPRPFEGIVVATGLSNFAQAHGVHFGLGPLVPGRAFEFVWLAGLLSAVWILPNTQQIFTRVVGPERSAGKEPAWLEWRPNWRWATAIGVIAAVAIAGVTGHSEFLYFQF